MKKFLIIATLLFISTCFGSSVESKQVSRFSLRPNLTPSENIIEPRMRHQVKRVCNEKLDIYVPDSEIERGVNYTFTATLNIQDSNG